MNDTRVFEMMRVELEAHNGVKIAFKDESRLMRLIGFLMFFNRAFMTDYITTLGRTVYFPTRGDLLAGPWETLAHEAVHVRDYIRTPVRFALSYLFPQCLAGLAVFALGAFFSPWFLIALVALVALGPWPAPGRVRWERRGYLMTMVCLALEHGPAYLRSSQQVEWMLSHYIDSSYYYMTRNSDKMRELIRADVESAIRIAQGRPFDEREDEYSWVVELVRRAA